MDLQTELLISEARRRTGLDDFGDPWFREPLEVLLRSMREEAALNATGRQIQGERILTGLVNRLRIRDFVNRNPGIRDEPVDVGCVIVGLGRSGSTLLQRLLAAAEGATAVYWWETLNPVPLPGEIPGQAEQRREIARAAVAAMLEAAPDLLSIHPMDAFAADEEVMLLEQSFVSSAPESFMNVPSYARWMEQADQGPAYRELREVLQALTLQDSSRRQKKWILKTPQHLSALPALTEVFPEASIVMPHRDPVQTVVSWCSLVDTLSAPNTDRLDRRCIGAHWSRRLARNLADFMATRDRLGERRFIDIRYAELRSDPVAVGMRVLAVIGLAADSANQARLAAWMAANSRDTRPMHVYAADEFGLSEAELREQFVAYRARHMHEDAH
ncbi:MAG: sulfotransferase [Gammaproteobacteria bacterium]|jgi:LPS sulfotransferase NodH|nr:sulfotransferase [Gammaproteobacteria bacterium]MBP6228625.1 sulfotransferase [Pseudomonadales bacterium]